MFFEFKIWIFSSAFTGFVAVSSDTISIYQSSPIDSRYSLNVSIPYIEPSRVSSPNGLHRIRYDRSSDVIPIMSKIASEYSEQYPIILNEHGDLTSSDYTLHTISDGNWIYVGTYNRNGTIILDGDKIMDKTMVQKESLSGPVKIGLLSPVSGSLSGFGEETRLGSIYGIETFNETLNQSVRTGISRSYLRTPRQIQ